MGEAQNIPHAAVPGGVEKPVWLALFPAPEIPAVDLLDGYAIYGLAESQAPAETQQEVRQP